MKGIEVRSGARGGGITKEVVERMFEMAQEHHIEPPLVLVCHPSKKNLMEKHLKDLGCEIKVICEAVIPKDEISLIGREPEVYVPFSYMDTPIYKAYSNLPKEGKVVVEADEEGAEE